MEIKSQITQQMKWDIQKDQCAEELDRQEESPAYKGQQDWKRRSKLESAVGNGKVFAEEYRHSLKHRYIGKLIQKLNQVFN